MNPGIRAPLPPMGEISATHPARSGCFFLREKEGCGGDGPLNLHLYYPLLITESHTSLKKNKMFSSSLIESEGERWDCQRCQGLDTDSFHTERNAN